MTRSMWKLWNSTDTKEDEQMERHTWYVVEREQNPNCLYDNLTPPQSRKVHSKFL